MNKKRLSFILTFVFLLTLSAVLKLTFWGHPIKEKNKSVSLDTKEQMRHGMQKDLWISTKQGEEHVKMQSTLSHIEISNPKKGTFEVKEDLQNIKGWFFEPDFVRYFEAKEGGYAFPQHNFFAQGVSFTYYPTNTPNMPLLWGKTEELFFSLEGLSIINKKKVRQ